MNTPDFDRIMSEALSQDHSRSQQPTIDLAATSWREGRRRRTRRLLGGGTGGVALVAAAAAAAFAINGGITPDASVTIPAGTGTPTQVEQTEAGIDGDQTPATATSTDQEQAASPTSEDTTSEDAGNESAQAPTSATGTVPIGYSVSMDAPDGWITMPLDIFPTEVQQAPVTIRQSCVVPQDGFATDGCKAGVMMEVGWPDTPPDNPESRDPVNLQCWSGDREATAVTSVEATGDTQVDVDGQGRSGNLRTWQATCADGSNFDLEELYIPSSGLLMHHNNGSADLTELAQSLTYDGSPDLEVTLLLVDDVQTGAWSGEVQEWDVSGPSPDFTPTGERLTIDLEGLTCRGDGTSLPGLDERGVTCEELGAEISQLQQTQGVVLRVMRDTTGTVYSVGIQFTA